MRIYLASILVLAACAQQKTTLTDDFSDLSGQDEKSDSFSYRMKIVGSLDYGQTSSSVHYTKTPRYRAMKFGGHAGDKVDLWVRSSNGGDAVAWVLDNTFHTLASNDDADANTVDSHISLTLPASPSITHYVVFRDYDLLTSNYTIALTGAAAGPSCNLDSDCIGIAIADGKVTECNNATKTCERIDIAAVHCGGFIMNSHACPTGYVCQVLPGNPDVGGHCAADH
ncbi:MAG: hypothetical protein JWO36_5950 [Myxococcales bacterium]|nr:hypothetical protein [Myxococcales bacterium]